MSGLYWCSDDIFAAIKAAIQGIHSQVRNVYLVVPESREGYIPPASIRVRSRERHDPGSGKYFCSHVTRPHGCAGFIIGTTYYVTEIGQVQTEPDQWGFCTKQSFTQSSMVDESYAGRWDRWNFTYTHLWGPRVEANGVRWQSTTWSYGQLGYPVSYETAKALAMASTPTTGEVLWRRYAYLDASQADSAPTFENRHVMDAIDFGTFPNVDAYLNDAYLEAFSKLPHVTTNNIQNLFAIYDLLKGIIDPIRNHERLVEGVGTLSDAWLGYRYVYSTTKSDITELVGYVERMRAMKRNGTTHVKSYGMASYDFDEGHYEIKCSLQARLEDYLGCYTYIEKLGLALDGYNAWDMIPFSFMVDWFLHIGDLIEGGRERDHALKLQPTAVWFSITHTFVNKFGCDQVDYYRWPSDLKMSATLPASMLTHGNARGSTWLKRAADALAIFG